ncbi:pyridoxamine 5'-phosphate oxidase family protein [Nonomuraea sp. 3-1Str]|uniref:pyridoxamine 5'-phosphate oxidase family protein n=1 Tax=Nonomuraea sp. 3-1Str TaxID=2929801 RepID=UPI0028565471|nr:pyridoxamine 5'-phosphate oxidase family protein [Nonomuraea sp. 3-1Str]MDR8411698.1 pyridoxamine 5'-phosphate oxidase family protein [Nonomuraea sp. 3-1Str]
MDPADRSHAFPGESHGEILDRDACMALLSAAVIGRVAWPHPDGRVEVIPVNFVVDGDDLVFRTARGDKLTAVERGVPVSFEVDDVEPALRVGWSVLLSGHAEIVDDAEQVRRLEALLGAPWVAMTEPVFVRLRPGTISGRRLPLHPGGVSVQTGGDG